MRTNQKVKNIELHKSYFICQINLLHSVLPIIVNLIKS